MWFAGQPRRRLLAIPADTRERSDPSEMPAAAEIVPEIVVVGSSNLDLVVEVDSIPVVGETVIGGDLRRISGGKGANQAVAAARLGRRVAMIGRVGDDDAGTFLRKSLNDNDVDTQGILETPNTPSGTAMIAVASDGDNAIVVSPGANARLTPGDITAHVDLLANVKVVLLQLEIPVEAVTAAAQAARSGDGIVILNPAPAPSQPLPDELMEVVDVLVPNQTELALLTRNTEPVTDTDQATELARQLPAQQIVVTLGAQGALVVTSDDSTLVPAPAVEAVDTTAAGDAFCGALADALADGADLVAATRWAVRVGAATTLRAGAQPSLPNRSELDQLLGS